MNAKKISIPFNYEAQKTDKGNWVLPIEIVGTGKVAQAYGGTKEECESIAKRIMHSVNTHDELVGSLRELLRTSEHRETNAKSNALNRALNILKQE